MTGTHCPRCSAVHFPGVPVCPECSGATEPIELDREGTVETWTTVHRAHDAEPVPYVLAWIWLTQGLRVLARWPDPAPPRVGAPVELIEAQGRITARPTVAATR